MRKYTWIAPALALAFLATQAHADFDKPVQKRWTKMEKNDKGEMEEVKYMTIDGILVHEQDPSIVPQPAIVTPGPAPAGGAVPDEPPGAGGADVATARPP